MGAVALKAGILHIDTAQIYGTEAETWGAIEKAGLKREDVWVTTKSMFITLTSNNKANNQPLVSHTSANIGQILIALIDVATNPEAIKSNIQESLSKLQSPPDLLLIHAPTVPEKGRIGEFWTILEGLVEDGTLKGTSLGVSNFRPQDLEDVLKVAKIMPVVNRESLLFPFQQDQWVALHSSELHLIDLG